jgi:4-hydroxy-tetrahydrodipicolinate reductase
LGKIRGVQYGLGPVGLEIVETLLTRPWAELVGVIDMDADKAGKDVGRFLKTAHQTGIIVSKHPDDVLSRTSPDVVTHATSSEMQTIYPQLVKMLEHEVNIISTAEELTYPFVKYPETAQKLDDLAKSKKKVVLGTGVNPGFLLDTLPVVLSGVCQQVTSIRAERVVDAARMSLPFQRRSGAGLTTLEFERRVADTSVRHIGLPESIGLIALAMGWKVGEIQERIAPIVAEKNLESKFLKVQAGLVAGIRQVAKGIVAGQELVVLDLRMYIGAQNPHDSILIEGVPSIDLTIKGGVQGDRATPAVVVNSIPRLESLEPRLRTVIDLPPPSARLNSIGEDRSVMLKTF